jgi:apolipoprotein D and lipocalin family protein
MINKLLMFTIVLFLTSCGSEKKLPVVNQLDLNRYAGKWYEIARMPSRFEKGLKCVTATYTMQPNGKIEVWNQGIDEQTLEPEEVRGSAKVPDFKEPAKLAVTFFWPFYGKYWVMDLDKDYEYALVGHPNREYLWILSRKPKLAEDTKAALLSKAKQLEFDTDKLEFVTQDCP